MKKTKLLFLISAAIFSLAAIVSCSANNNEKKEDEGKKAVISHNRNIEKSTDFHTANQGASYIMRLDNKTLTLYEITGGRETPITAVLIEPSYYPPEDIKALNKGVVAYSKEEGFARLENFTN